MTRKLVFAASLIIIVVGMLGVASDLHVECASPYIDVDVDTAYNMITNGSYPDLMVLDVRTQSEYDNGHIYRAVWIPHTELEARISELAGHEDHEIIVYCLSGSRSVTASSILDSHDFTKVYNMLDGISAWQSQGYPVWTATVHNVNTTFDYDTIQGAINAPQTLNGHTIFVDEGTYDEHVVVNKTVSLIGENKHSTIIDGNGTGTVVTIAADNVTVTNFTIQRGGLLHDAGIFLDHCCNNLITNNVIKENGGNGIYTSSSRTNVLRQNTVTDNKFGIFVHWSHYNRIDGNLVTNNEDNIKLVYSSNNTMVRNALFSGDTGVNAFYNCRYNEINENMVENNIVGITFADACKNNKVYHNNFVNNTEHASILDPHAVPPGIKPSKNTWDYGYPSGGNYWSDYAGVDLYSGPCQNETGSDGTGDTSYIIDEDNTDGHPLMQPYHGPVRNLNTGQSYSTIQEGISSAGEGDTIFVLSGTYYESLIVNKSLALIGENKHTTIIDSNATGTVARVSANHVNISGFTIQGGGIDPFEGSFGLYLVSNDNVISQNIFRNSVIGIVIRYSDRNVISKNLFTNFTALYGIRMYNSVGNKIIENNITHTQLPGIFTTFASGNEFRKNYLANNGGGIYFGSCSDNNITENVINNSWIGIGLELSSYNNLKQNSIIGNRYGLRLGPLFHPCQTGCNDNVITENDVVNNEDGIHMVFSNNNLIWRNNFINNTRQSWNDHSTNAWDDELEGNYWSDYYGVDSNYNGIGDTIYEIDDENKDNHPLMGLFSSFQATLGYHVNIISNSTVEDFHYFKFNSTIRIRVSNMTADQIYGFCRICIPHALMNETYYVTIDDAEPLHANYTLCDDGDNRWIYFSYQHSTLEIIIIPEFPSFLILPLFMITTLLAVIMYRRKHNL